MNVKRICVMAILIFVSGVVFSETVYLKDGSKVVGTIIQSDENSVKIKTDLGELIIPKDKIKRISYTEEKEDEGRGNINIQIQQQQ